MSSSRTDYIDTGNSAWFFELPLTSHRMPCQRPAGEPAARVTGWHWGIHDALVLPIRPPGVRRISHCATSVVTPQELELNQGRFERSLIREQKPEEVDGRHPGTATQGRQYRPTVSRLITFIDAGPGWSSFRPY